MLNVIYRRPGVQKLAVSVLEVATGNVWDPATKTFLPAGAPGSMVPMSRVQYPPLAAVLTASVPGFPAATSEEQYVVHVHDQADGSVVGDPIGVPVSTHAPTPNVVVSPAFVFSFPG